MAGPTTDINTNPAANGGGAALPANIQQLQDQAEALLNAAGQDPSTTSQTGGEIIGGTASDEHHEQLVNAHGAQLAAQLEQQNLAHQNQINQMQGDYQRTIGSLEQRIQDLTGNIQNLQNNTPVTRQQTPDEIFALDQNELAEVENTQTAIEKLAAIQASKITDKALQGLRDEFNTERAAMQSTIDELKSVQQLQGNQSRTTYDTVVQSSAAQLGLDARSLPNDMNFQKFIAQPINPYVPSQGNIANTIKAAEDQGRSDITVGVLQGYAQYLQDNNIAPPAGGLSNAPVIPAGGGAGAVTEEGGGSQADKLISMRAEVASNIAELNQLNAQRGIPVDEYRQRMQHLTQLDDRLLSALGAEISN